MHLNKKHIKLAIIPQMPQNTEENFVELDVLNEIEVINMNT
jgi:hypothetical protein